MPRISQARVPVQRAVLQPIQVRTGGEAVARALGGVGQEISGIGAQLKAQEDAASRELQRRKQELLLLRGKLKSKSVMSQNDIAIDTLTDSSINPDPETWTSDVKKQINNARADLNRAIAGMPQDERDIELLKFNLWEEQRLVESEAKSIQQIGIDTQAAASADYIEAIESGDELKIAESLITLDDVLSMRMDEDEKDVFLKRLTLQGEKRLKENVKKNIIEAAVLSPDAIIDQLNQEISARTDGAGDPNLAPLDNADIEAAIDFSKSVSRSHKTRIKQAGEEAISEQEVQFDKLIGDNQLTPQSVESWDISTLPKSVRGDAVSTKNKWRNVAKSLAQDVDKRTNTSAALQDVEAALVKLRRGNISQTQYNSILNTNIPGLSDTSYQSYLASGRTNFIAAQNDSIESNRPLMKAVLFPRGETGLLETSQLLRQAMADGNQDKIDIFTAATNIGRAREWNYRVASRMLDDFVESKPDASSIEIQNQADLIRSGRHWTPAKLLNEYEKEFENTSQSVLDAPPVQGVSAEWKTLSRERRAQVFQLVDAGAKPDLIRTAIKNQAVTDK